MPSLKDQFPNPNTPILTVTHNGYKFWELPNGELHRTDGPAVEYPSGSKAWFLHDQHLTEAEFNA